MNIFSHAMPLWMNFINAFLNDSPFFFTGKKGAKGAVSEGKLMSMFYVCKNGKDMTGMGITEESCKMVVLKKVVTLPSPI